MNDAEFFAHLAVFLEDAVPEQMLKDKVIIQRIMNTMYGENVSLNFHVLSILRAWTRKMQIRLKIEEDERIGNESSQKLREAIVPFCRQFALGASTFFKHHELLPLACVCCKELLECAKIPTTPEIVEHALKQLHFQPVRIALLEVIANANSEVDGLPILDPEIVFQWPTLHRQLLHIVPEYDRQDYEEIRRDYDKVCSMNRGLIDIERNFVSYCDFDAVCESAPPELFAEHPDPSVRAKFYARAKNLNKDITQFHKSLICKGVFDPAVEQDALFLLKEHFDELKSAQIGQKEIAHLQCVKWTKEEFGKLSELIETTDDYAVLCSWLRFLFHKDESIRNEAVVVLKEIFPFEVDWNLEAQPYQDGFVVRYQQYLAKQGQPMNDQLYQSLFETVLSTDQTDFIKDIAAKKLIDIVLDPRQEVNKYLPRLRELPFARFPILLHALAIRDGDWEIGNVQRVFELVHSINSENSIHLLPILTRVAFKPLLLLEGNGSSPLRLPDFASHCFEVRGNGGFLPVELYKDTPAYKFDTILKQWVSFKQKREFPIRDGFDIKSLTSYTISNPLLAADILCQIDDDHEACDKLVKSGPAQLVLYLLLIAVLAAKTSSSAAARICEELTPQMPATGMKLNQALTEFGGDCALPDKITDYIIDQQLRRAALSLVITHMQFGKKIVNVDFERVFSLFDYELPINVLRQAALMLSESPKSKDSEFLIHQRDAIIKAIGLHITAPSQSSIDSVITIAMNEKEALCVRASAVEYLANFYLSRPNEIRADFSVLYPSEPKETMLNLQLLRLAAVPSVRNTIPNFLNFVEAFFEETSSPLFSNAALIALVGYTDIDESTADIITQLAMNPNHYKYALDILCSYGTDTLQLFTSRIITTIAQNIALCDPLVELVCINNLVVAGIEFPGDAMPGLLSVYDSFSDRACLHNVLSVVFNASFEAREAAIDNGFVDTALAEYTKTKKAFVLETLSVFMYDFEPGQEAVANTLTVGGLLSLFSLTDVVLKFFLCLTFRNEYTQSLFVEATGDKSLMEAVFASFDNSRVVPHDFLLLMAHIMNSSKVREYIIKRRKMQKLLMRLTYSVTHADYQLCEHMLKIFATLTLYEDGCQEIFEKTQSWALFVKMIDDQTISSFTVFHLLIHNLKSNPTTWKALTTSARDAGRATLDHLTSLAKSAKQATTVKRP